MIGELISLSEADAIRRAVVADQINAGNLGFLSAIVSHDGGTVKRLVVRPHDRAHALVKPLRRRADASRLRPAALQPDLKHLHAVG